MAYRLPTFILPIRIFTGPFTGGAPRVVTLGNLSPGSRVTQVTADPPAAFADRLYLHLMVPKGTDVRGQVVGYPTGDALECPTGSGRWYNVTWVDDVAKGFPNEYRLVLMFQNLNVAFAPVWPQPTP